MSIGSRISAATKGYGKLLVGVSVVVLGFIGYVYVTGPAPAVNPSTVQKGPMGGTPTIQGGERLSPQYDAELSKADNSRIAEAQKTGASAIPTLRPGTAEQRAPIQLLDPVKEDTPIVETPKIDAAPIVVQQQLAPVPIVTAPPPQIAQQSPERLDAMKTYMNSLRRGNPVAEVTTYADLDKMAKAQQAVAQQTAPAVAASAASTAAVSKVKIPLPGKILYAQLISRANSDAPGPVLARIVQGDLAGATLIGSFQKAQDALIISFDRMTVDKDKDGNEINETVAIKSVAVSTDYLDTAMATSVDRHMFQKLAIGFTTAFAQGFGQAISQNGQTTYNTSTGTITNSQDKLNTKEELESAGGKAVASAGDVLNQEFGKVPTTIKVESGTPLGILFL